MALAPGHAEPLALGAGLSAADDDQGYVLFTNAERVPVGLLTPTGAWLHGGTAPGVAGGCRPDGSAPGQAMAVH